MLKSVYFSYMLRPLTGSLPDASIDGSWDLGLAFDTIRCEQARLSTYLW